MVYEVWKTVLRLAGDLETNNEREKRSYFNKGCDNQHRTLQFVCRFRLSRHRFHCRTPYAAYTNSGANCSQTSANACSEDCIANVQQK